MHLHHATSIFGIFVGIYLGGMIGSLSQLTWITEGSTPFVDFRYLMVYHKMEGQFIYIVNGALMCLSFFTFRIVFYHIVIFEYLVHYCLYRTEAFWALQYPDQFKSRLAIFSIIMYILMYGLQLMWFTKIASGLLEALGLKNISYPTAAEQKAYNKVKDI
jgi:hypothetical protein